MPLTMDVDQLQRVCQAVCHKTHKRRSYNGLSRVDFAGDEADMIRQFLLVAPKSIDYVATDIAR